MKIPSTFYVLSLCSIVSIDTILNIHVIENKVHVYFQKNNNVYKTTWIPSKKIYKFTTSLEHLVINKDEEIWTEPELIFENVTLLDTTKFNVVDYKLVVYDNQVCKIFIYDYGINLPDPILTISYPTNYVPLVYEENYIWFKHNDKIKIYDIKRKTWLPIEGIVDVKKIHRYGGYIYVWDGNNYLVRYNFNFQFSNVYILPANIKSLEFTNVAGEPYFLIIDSSGKITAFSIFELQGTNNKTEKIGTCYTYTYSLISSDILHPKFEIWTSEEFSVIIFSNPLKNISSCRCIPITFRPVYYTLTIPEEVIIIGGNVVVPPSLATKICDYYTINQIDENLYRKTYCGIISVTNTTFNKYIKCSPTVQYTTIFQRYLYCAGINTHNLQQTRIIKECIPVSTYKDWYEYITLNLVVGHITYDASRNKYILVATPKDYSNLHLLYFDDQLNLIEDISFLQSVRYPNLFITPDNNYLITFALCGDGKLGSIQFNIDNDLSQIKFESRYWDQLKISPSIHIYDLQRIENKVSTYSFIDHLNVKFNSYSYIPSISNYLTSSQANESPSIDDFLLNLSGYSYSFFVKNFSNIISKYTDNFLLNLNIRSSFPFTIKNYELLKNLTFEYSRLQFNSISYIPNFINNLTINFILQLDKPITIPTLNTTLPIVTNKDVDNLILHSNVTFTNDFTYVKSYIQLRDFGKSNQFLYGWNYNAFIEVNNLEDQGFEDFQILFILDTKTLITKGLMIDDASDLRFTYINPLTNLPTLLHYWIEDYTLNTESTRIWIRLPYMPVNTTYVYMYSGNTVLLDLYSDYTSNGYNTFDIFDLRFEGPLTSADYTSGMINYMYNVYDWGNNEKEYFHISNIKNAYAISYGFDHSLILTKDNKLYIRGYGFEGQLGLDYSNFSNWLNFNINNEIVQYISCGSSHTLILTKEKNMYGWGNNEYGQLGTDTLAHYIYSPTIIPIPSTIETVACGNDFSLMLTSYKNVYVCGFNDEGQLGLGDNVIRKNWTFLPNFNNVIQIAAGGDHSLLLTEDGEVWSCGFNILGQLGLGGTMNVYSFTKIPTLSNIVFIAAGGDHSLAIDINGYVWCWGSNEYGQLGLEDGENKKYSLVPAKITYIENVVFATCGSNTSFLITSNGKIWGCGNNEFRQLSSTISENYIYTFIELPIVISNNGNLTHAISYKTPIYFIRKYIEKEPIVTLINQ